MQENFLSELRAKEFAANDFFLPHQRILATWLKWSAVIAQSILSHVIDVVFARDATSSMLSHVPASMFWLSRDLRRREMRSNTIIIDHTIDYLSFKGVVSQQEFVLDL